MGNLGKINEKKKSRFYGSEAYVKQCPLIVKAACVLADVRACWQNTEEASFRSLCSCYVMEACLSGCPLSPAHTTSTAVASDQLEAWASISLYGFLSAYLDLQLYIGAVTSKGTGTFFSFSSLQLLQMQCLFCDLRSSFSAAK